MKNSAGIVGWVLGLALGIFVFLGTAVAADLLTRVQQEFTDVQVGFPGAYHSVLMGYREGVLSLTEVEEALRAIRTPNDQGIDYCPLNPRRSAFDD